MVLCGTSDPNVGGWCRVVPNFFLFLGHIGPLYQVISPKSPKIYGVGRWVHKFVPNKTVFLASLISTSFHFFQQLDQHLKNQYKETGSRATYSEPLIVQTHNFNKLLIQFLECFDCIAGAFGHHR